MRMYLLTCHTTLVQLLSSLTAYPHVLTHVPYYSCPVAQFTHRLSSGAFSVLMAVRLAAFVPPDALVHALRPPRHAAEVLALPLPYPLTCPWLHP